MEHLHTSAPSWLEGERNSRSQPDVCCMTNYRSSECCIFGELYRTAAIKSRASRRETKKLENMP